MKIICVGRNFIDHVKELNNPIPTEPLIFLKPDSAILRKGFPFYLPEFSQNIHYECELVVKINKVGRSIQAKFAHRYYDEIALGIDFTARDLQSKLKEKSHPWELAKGFDQSAFISEFYPKENYNINHLKFQLQKNSKPAQEGNTKDWIFDIDKLISYISKFYTLKKGDVIFTGTPSGVGQVASGDLLEGFLENQKVFSVQIK